MAKNTQSTPDAPEAVEAAVDAAETAAETAVPGNVTEFPGFSAQKFEIPDTVREIAEQGVERAKHNYETFKNAAEEATDMMEDAYENARKGFVDLNLKAIENAQSNTDRVFAFAKQFVTAKSVSDAVELQTKFAREQFETLTSQVKDMQELATKVASESSAPVKDIWEKTQEKMKVA
jgi:phasin